MAFEYQISLQCLPVVCISKVREKEYIAWWIWRKLPYETQNNFVYIWDFRSLFTQIDCERLILRIQVNILFNQVWSNINHFVREKMVYWIREKNEVFAEKKSKKLWIHLITLIIIILWGFPVFPHSHHSFPIGCKRQKRTLFFLNMWQNQPSK